MKRLFLALPPREEDAAALWRQWEMRRTSSPRIRWLLPEDYHITLIFFGPVEEERISLIREQMDSCVPLYKPFVLKSAGADQFPRRGEPRVYVESLEDTDGRLGSLHSLLRRNLESDFSLERRKFLPHITTARLKKSFGDLPPYRDEPLAFVLDRLVLFESRLHPSGAVYDPLYEIFFPPETGIVPGEEERSLRGMEDPASLMKADRQAGSEDAGCRGRR
jgi:2'-5' RNA ligase